MIKHITLDREKVLDEAIFMLLEARRKCYEGFTLSSVDRIDLAINNSKKVIDYLNDNFNSSNYPTVDKLIDDNIISKKSDGCPAIGDVVGFFISYGRLSRINSFQGFVKEIIEIPNNLDGGMIYSYKITYIRNGRRNTVTRLLKDIIFFGD